MVATKNRWESFRTLSPSGRLGPAHPVAWFVEFAIVTSCDLSHIVGMTFRIVLLESMLCTLGKPLPGESHQVDEEETIASHYPARSAGRGTISFPTKIEN